MDSLLAGDYSVLAVDSTGCIGTTDFVIDAIDGITQPGAVWHVFPNPASDIVQVNLSTPGRGELTLTDLGGREVMSNHPQFLEHHPQFEHTPSGHVCASIQAISEALHASSSRDAMTGENPLKTSESLGVMPGLFL